MDKGTLYIVATPIGNLGDITLRAIETLKNADVIAAEDTRHTLKLLNNLGIKNRLVSFFEHSPEAKAQEIISMLEEGKSVALVSDAGMPLISDPGAPLTRFCAERGIPFTCVPGACAAVTAAVLSALPTEKFTFEGFLPKDKKERKDALLHALKCEYTTILYESPHAIKRTLSDIAALYPERRLSVCKELTKLHESVLRGSAKELSGKFSQIDEVRGEFVIVIEGCPIQKRELTDEDILAMLNEKLNAGLKPKEAIKQTAALLDVGKNRVYSLYTDNSD